MNAPQNAQQNVLRAVFASFALRDFRLLWLVVCLSMAPLTIAATLELNLGIELSGASLRSLSLLRTLSALVGRCSLRRACEATCWSACRAILSPAFAMRQASGGRIEGSGR